VNLEKSQLKIQLANNLGADIEDRLAGEQRAVHELEGANDALRQAAVKVPQDLAAKVDTALAEGELKDMTALEASEFAKKYLTKAGDYLMHLATMEKSKAEAQKARVQGLEFAMDTVKELRDAEVDRMQGVLNAIEEDEDPPRTEAELARKAHGSLAERRADAKAKKAEAPRPKKKIPKDKTARKARKRSPKRAETE
jgi:hypothetical protein